MQKRFAELYIVIGNLWKCTPRGTIEIRNDPGFGYDLDHDFIRQITVREESVG